MHTMGCGGKGTPEQVATHPPARLRHLHRPGLRPGPQPARRSGQGRPALPLRRPTRRGGWRRKPRVRGGEVCGSGSDPRCWRLHSVVGRRAWRSGHGRLRTAWYRVGVRQLTPTEHAPRPLYGLRVARGAFRHAAFSARAVMPLRRAARPLRLLPIRRRAVRIERVRLRWWGVRRCAARGRVSPR